jgi:hypothetical protein
MVLQERSFDGAGPPFMPGTSGLAPIAAVPGGGRGFRVGPTADTNQRTSVIRH